MLKIYPLCFWEDSLADLCRDCWQYRGNETKMRERSEFMAKTPIISLDVTMRILETGFCYPSDRREVYLQRIEALIQEKFSAGLETKH